MFQSKNPERVLLSTGRKLSRTQENDRARGKLGYSMSDAANQVPIQPGEPACREHDGIALRISCRRNYLVCRLPQTDLKVCTHILADVLFGKSSQAVCRLPLQ